MCLLANAIRRRPTTRGSIVAAGLIAGKPLNVTVDEINEVLDSKVSEILAT